LKGWNRFYFVVENKRQKNVCDRQRTVLKKNER